MYPEVSQKIDDVISLCVQCKVARLYLFGSSLRDDFNPERSDFDFLVDFRPMPPGEFAEAFFMLKEGLESLFQREVDLVTQRSIRNPYFLQAVSATRQVLYAA